MEKIAEAIPWAFGGEGEIRPPIEHPSLHAVIILRTSVPELSNKIIQKGLAFGRIWSGSVLSSGRLGTLRDLAPPA